MHHYRFFKKRGANHLYSQWKPATPIIRYLYCQLFLHGLVLSQEQLCVQ